jgi:hypothetical protein
MIYAGAQINEQTNNQILRVAELRNILERLKTDWDLIILNGGINSTSILNNTFKKALLHFCGLLKKYNSEFC